MSERDATDPRVLAVLDFWFGAPGSPDYGRARKLWFKKNAAFDALLRERFGALIAAARAGELDAWTATRCGTLALVIVLDQFSRNCHRGSALAFAGDEKALAENTPEFQVEKGYAKSAPGKANLSMSTNQLAERYGAVGMTLEMPFKDHAPNPDPVHAWSPERSKKLAHACLETLAQQIGDL